MNKQDFIDSLEKDNLTKEEKIVACQFYIDNFPVVVTTPDMLGRLHKSATTLDIKIDGGSDKAVDAAFNKLKDRINEFKLS